MMLGRVLMPLILFLSFLYFNYFIQERLGSSLKNENPAFLTSDFVFFESGDTSLSYAIKENVISFFNVLSHRSSKVRNNAFFEGGMLINKYNQYLHNFFLFQNRSFKLSLSITFRKLLI